MADERFEQLERRIAALEGLVRQLLVGSVAAAGPLPQSHPASSSEPEAESTPTVAAVPRVVIRPKIDFLSAPPPSTPASQSLDWEQWFGQRGLLAVGVLALLTAAGFFLKYAFDRGWVSPLLRSLGAIAVGIAVAVWGHERIGRGMRRYGAALIGAGGGLAYLGLWAAAGPYALVDRRLGILLLATTTVAVTLLAIHHEVEGLAIWALGGAYLAPIILANAPNPMGFLAYLEVVALGTGILAYTMNWRRTFDLALFGYFVLAMSGAAHALGTPSGFWLVAAGGVLALHVTHNRPWPESRVLLVLLTWSALALGAAGTIAPTQVRWIGLGAIALVFAVLWWQQMSHRPFATGTPLSAASAEQLLFFANPVALLVLAYALEIPVLHRSPEIVPAVLAVIYVGAGWQRRAAEYLIMGFALGAFAAAAAWNGSTVAMAWTLLALVALAAERQYGRPGGRHAATGLATAAFLCLFTTALGVREGTPFTDDWSRALYVFLAATAVAARWWGTDDKPLWKRGGAEWMWILCGAALFVGGSIEFQGQFARMTPLAGDLALSVWWLVYAGTLVWLGFRLDRKLIRSAGLVVAGLAGLKIVLYDLSTLNALYRVGSFFALAIIALAVAYAYNERAKASAA
jgi:uncharacterized membrane protein